MCATSERTRHSCQKYRQHGLRGYSHHVRCLPVVSCCWYRGFIVGRPEKVWYCRPHHFSYTRGKYALSEHFQRVDGPDVKHILGAPTIHYIGNHHCESTSGPLVLPVILAWWWGTSHDGGAHDCMPPSAMHIQQRCKSLITNRTCQYFGSS